MVLCIAGLVGLDESMREQTDEDDELFRTIMKTEHNCSACDDPLCYTDEVVVIKVVAPSFENGLFTYADAEADDGDFLYEPRFADYGCWEDAANEVGELVEDLPPIEDPAAVLLCKLCSSGILLGELMGLVTMGELHCSQRSPDIASTTIFEAQDPDPVTICIVCLRKLSDEFLDLWDSVGQGDECEEGATIRCWRLSCPGAAACLLKCS